MIKLLKIFHIIKPTRRITQNTRPIMKMMSDGPATAELKAGTFVITLNFAMPIHGVRTITMNPSPAGAAMRNLSG